MLNALHAGANSRNWLIITEGEKMSFWSGEKILANQSVVEPFDTHLLDCNAYNLRMGSEYFRTSDAETGEIQTRKSISAKESFIIPSGQFAYLLTKEKVSVPKTSMAFISIRTGIKFQGLINVSGFHVDPGYSGIVGASGLFLSFALPPIFKASAYLFDLEIHRVEKPKIPAAPTAAVPPTSTPAATHQVK